MKKALYILLIISLMVISLAGCTKKEEEEEEPTTIADSVKFKEEYESLNGQTNSSGNEHRTITIDENNPIVYTTPENVIKMIENKETFYVYFGSKYCPWCRSVIEKAIKVANENNIKKIYYVDIWGDDHEEILRDVYVLDDKNKPQLSVEGTTEYQELLKLFDKVLEDYKLTTAKGKKVSVGEKRITAPNFIYVSEGEATKLETGISSKQSNSRDELTDKILEDEEKLFTKFFSE